VGGVGFLAANRFGGMFAHAGITAEGDARVLWAKVSKEFLDLIQSGEFSRQSELVAQAKFPVVTVPTSVGDLLRLLGELRAVFAARLTHKAKILGGLYARAGAEASKEKPLRVQIFDATMYKYSNEIQGVAQAYAEWEALRSFLLILDSRGADPALLFNCPASPPQLSDGAMMALGRLCLLFALEAVLADAVELCGAALMSAEQGLTCKAVMTQLCHDLRPDILSLVDGFNVNEASLRQPIAKDWKQFNACDNFGEVVDTGRLGTDKA